MTGEAVTKTLVEAAVNKGIHDMRENPARAIRNLVDLGAMFAGGRYQKEFFCVAQEELKNDDSIYYQLVEQVVCQTSPAVLKTFGMNLIYNCWNVGAKKIREKEGRENFNIPWTLIYQLQKWPNSDISLLTKCICQGKKLGIYCHMFFIGSQQQLLEKLLPVLRTEKDCAFLLFVSPALLSDSMIDCLESIKTVFVIADSNGVDWDSCASKLALLNERHFLCGVSCNYSSMNDWPELRKIQTKIAQTGCAFLFLINEKTVVDNVCSTEVQNTISQWRRSLTNTVFPIALYHDVAFIDKNISSEPCLVKVCADGKIIARVNKGVALESEQTLFDCSLEQLLKNTLTPAALVAL